jgi:hypothetical protein
MHDISVRMRLIETVFYQSCFFSLFWRKSSCFLVQKNFFPIICIKIEKRCKKSKKFFFYELDFIFLPLLLKCYMNNINTCGMSATLFKVRKALAQVAQLRLNFVARLLNLSNYATILIHVCSSRATLPQSGFTFAQVEQPCHNPDSRLLRLSNPATHLIHVCSSRATLQSHLYTVKYINS